MHVRAALWRLRLENLKFKASLGHILIPYLSKEKKNLGMSVSTFVP